MKTKLNDIIYKIKVPQPRISISEENAHVSILQWPGDEKIDGLLSEALTRHFNPKGWHFVNQNNMFITEGKTVGKILKRKSCLPFCE